MTIRKQIAAAVAELVQLYRSKGFDAADRRARVLIITRNLDQQQTAEMLRGFAREAYA